MELARGIKYMICRHGNVDLKVSKGKCKFITAPKLAVLPTLHIIVHGHSGIELCNYITSIAIVKGFVTTTGAVYHVVVDIVPPFYGKGKFLARL